LVFKSKTQKQNQKRSQAFGKRKRQNGSGIGAKNPNLSFQNTNAKTELKTEPSFWTLQDGKLDSKTAGVFGF
tara:strand:- start:31 stop:246 length:216 start_codon:yes stop_codon:yes gene_type:complete